MTTPNNAKHLDAVLTQIDAKTATEKSLPPSSDTGTIHTDLPGTARRSMNKMVQVQQHAALHEELRKLLGHLHAQTMLISGEGLENFCNHNDQIKSDYLWAMSDTAERALKLLEDAC
ncbi:hypothetical protein QN362_11545 [Actimicrobium sp. CCC2.4]|uniref:hypothetical protein n=1 Tax=Actimicrobium sp. CCC2.4 TaxID=3048606 RepID=UPI002AC9DDDB|nr:hypothetical protein [Actimicrobium sp. CCC2.4]MEB0135963.1 hypothetical protein [Actimicrobium sp. CCC2.4]WPX32626.1 hypothetical protein RHM62_01905 [Actimicrobium sp. CCC2.4]